MGERREHEVEVGPFKGEVEVRANGVVLAKTSRALALNETGYPRRFYLPEADVKVALEPNPHRTHCPYKGDAVYANVAVNGLPIERAAWSYPEPIAAVPGLAGHWCFDPNMAETTVEAAG